MKPKHIIITAASIAGAFIIYYAYKQISLLLNYSYKFVGFKVINYSLTNTTVQASISISNASDINVTITGYVIYVYINSTYITTLRSTTAVKIGAKSSTVLPINITFNPSQVFNTLITEVLKSALSVRMSGIVSLSVNGIPKSISIDDTEPLSF